MKANGQLLIPGMLRAQELKVINEFFNEKLAEFTPALVGKGKQHARMEQIRGDLTYWLDPLDPPGPFKGIISFIESLKRELNQNLFLGLKEFECHLALYPVGAFYQKHLDRFEQDASRAVSFVFYLNEEWNDDDGGELVLYSKDGSVTKISPSPGTFVCFLSDEFPHEVLVSKKERRSLTGWIHTRIIN